MDANQTCQGQRHHTISTMRWKSLEIKKLSIEGTLISSEGSEAHLLNQWDPSRAALCVTMAQVPLPTDRQLFYAEFTILECEFTPRLALTCSL